MCVWMANHSSSKSFETMTLITTASSCVIFFRSTTTVSLNLSKNSSISSKSIHKIHPDFYLFQSLHIRLCVLRSPSRHANSRRTSPRQRPGPVRQPQRTNKKSTNSPQMFPSWESLLISKSASHLLMNIYIYSIYIHSPTYGNFLGMNCWNHKILPF